jgi:hypothetical protein
LSFNVANPPGANAEKHVVGPIAPSLRKGKKNMCRGWITNGGKIIKRLHACQDVIFENVSITFIIWSYVSENYRPVRLEIWPAFLAEVQVPADKEQSQPGIQ